MTTQGLPHSLLRLFEPRPPIAYFPPLTKPPLMKKKAVHTSITATLAGVEEKDIRDDVPFVYYPTKEEIRANRKEKKQLKAKRDLEENVAAYDPVESLKTMPDATEDPLKTLFIGRLSFDLTEEQLRREFDEYGPIRKVTIVRDVRTGKSRGYAFVEYEREKDLRLAYTRGDGKKIDNRRCVVDVERGRTVPGWKPRKLGGGKGKTRVGGKDKNQATSGRDEERMPVEDRDDRDRDRDRRSYGDSYNYGGGRDRGGYGGGGRGHGGDRYGGSDRYGGGGRDRSGLGSDRDSDRRGHEPRERYGRRDDDRGGYGGDRSRGGYDNRDRDRGRDSYGGGSYGSARDRDDRYAPRDREDRGGERRERTYR